MEDNAKLIETLLEKAADFGKTGYELAKLKALDKTSDVVSSFIPNSIAFLVLASFLLFLSLGSAFWLGEILGKTWYGFFVLAAFYGISWIVVNFLIHKWLKKLFCNYIIKQVLK